MRHAIKTLQQEETKLSMHISVGKRDGKPAGWRASEFAMHMGSLTKQKQDVADALAVLYEAEAKSE